MQPITVNPSHSLSIAHGSGQSGALDSGAITGIVIGVVIGVSIVIITGIVTVVFIVRKNLNKDNESVEYDYEEC